MTELSKSLSSIGLLGAGFVAASMLGPPDFTQQLVGNFSARPPSNPTTGLQPIDGESWASLLAPPLPRQVAPASIAEPAPVSLPQTLNQPIALNSEPSPPKEVRIADKPWDWPLPQDHQSSVQQASTWNTLDSQFLAPDWALQSPSLAAEPTPATVEGELVEHIVTDGDTLQRIAELYLGDSRRADEIYALNRDQLAQPDLLPIGATLRAPARRTPRLPSVGDGAALTPRMNSPNSDSQLRPRAKLQAPTPGEMVSFGKAGW